MLDETEPIIDITEQIGKGSKRIFITRRNSLTVLDENGKVIRIHTGPTQECEPAAVIENLVRFAKKGNTLA